MKSGGKIFVVHPSRNLLEVVIEHLLERDHLETALVLFPNRRPVEFFKYYLCKKIDRPVLLPELKSFEDWLVSYAIGVMKEPVQLIDQMEQAWFVYKAVEEVYAEEKRKVPSWGEFYPWAIRLVDVFREFEMELVEVGNLVHPPSVELHERVIDLLMRLKRIYEAFNKKLDDHSCTTVGKLMRSIADSSENLPDIPVYLVGFYALTRSERAIFRRFFERGASIYWHADIETLPEFYKNWLKDWHEIWQIEPEVIMPEKIAEPEIHLFEAHDLHSELKEVGERLSSSEKVSSPDHTAVVLPSSEPLIPLIHHLPEADLNITMGYPLRLTGIANFIQKLFRLVLGANPERGYMTSTLIDLFNSPYIRVSKETIRALKEYGGGFISEQDVLKFTKEDKDYVRSVFEKIIHPLIEAKNLRTLGDAINTALGFISPGRWSPFEKEAIAVILENVVYPMKEYAFSEEEMEMGELHELFLEVLRTTSIPFEGDPLTGIQVMGILETRVLSFERVILIDVNEGVLPGVEDINPLLPRQVRPLLGLPDHLKEELIIRYHFERLISSSKETHLLWQYCTTPGQSGLDDKKVRSRYVEKIIWQKEKEQGKLFEETSEDEKFRRSQITLEPGELTKKDYLKKDTDLIDSFKVSLWAIHPTMLELYLKCPLRFFYSQVLKIEPPSYKDEVEPAELGTAVHEALEEYIRTLTGIKTDQVNFSGVTLKKQNLSVDDFFNVFIRKLKGKDFYRRISPERKFLLEETARFRFRKYFEEKHPEETKVVALEKRLDPVKIDVGGHGRYELKGKVDRIDRRGENGDVRYIIMDYKTGYTGNVKTKCLNLTLSDIKSLALDDNGLRELKKHFSTIQLPFYIYLWGRFLLKKYHSSFTSWEDITAAFVKLSENGGLAEFYPSRRGNGNSGYNQWFEEVFPEVVKFIIRHLFESPYWYPAEDKEECKYCDYKVPCRFSV
ncbi:MAG: PD-(D/E)XK nuclease family protein [Nitrospirae bacterium]|nr:MAG: PD-(D/E)XK nuclease family protein [Nitrospirota bacterium]